MFEEPGWAPRADTDCRDCGLHLVPQDVEACQRGCRPGTRNKYSTLRNSRNGGAASHISTGTAGPSPHKEAQALLAVWGLHSINLSN